MITQVMWSLYEQNLIGGNTMKRILFSFILLSAFASSLYAVETAPTPELLTQGRELFNKKEGLGAKFACILCHQKDKAIQKSKLEKIGDNLPVIINKYLTEKSKGPALAAESEKMKALMAYIRYEHAK